MGRELNFNLEISDCRTYGCWPRISDVNSDGQFWVWGNGTTSGPSTLTAILGPHGFTGAALQKYPNSGVTLIGAPWFSPAGRAGNGNLYLSAFGWEGPSGIIVTTFIAGTITYASSTVNSAAANPGNVQTIGGVEPAARLLRAGAIHLATTPFSLTV